MAEKMKEKYQKSKASAKKQSVTNINRADRLVTLNIYTFNNQTSNDNNDNPPKDTEDYPSECGLFGWEEIGTCHVPYISRKINGENILYVPLRIAETQLLQKYLKFLHQDIFSCTCMRSHFVSELEAKLLNEINTKHSEFLYGNDPFCVGKDFVILLDDVKELYAFLETCYTKLLCNNTPGGKCGFIFINSESVVPYCIKDNHKYIPLFYFEGETEILRHRAIKLENWHWAYLKFCCNVQGIRNELLASDSCTVTSLDDVKNYFPPDTVYEEYWPPKVVDIQLLTNAKTATLNTSGSLIRVPHPSENPYAAVAAAIAQTPILPPPLSMPLGITTTPNHQMDSKLMHESYTPINNGVGHAPPLPLVQESLQSVLISNSGSYSNGSINHTAMYNPVSSNVSPSNQEWQFYGAQGSNSVGRVQQQQPIINQPLQSYRSQPLHGGSATTRMTNTQQSNVLGNITHIDLSSPPPSPLPQHNSRRTRNTPSILKRRLENSTQRPRASNAAAHKKSKLSHESYTPINNGVGHAPPLPLVQESLQSVLISNSGSYSNGSINHTAMYNPVSSNVSPSNQEWQFYGAQGSNSVGRVQQQQPIINQPLQSYRSQPLHGGSATTRMTNTQQSNVLGNITHIDLSSPPPSPLPQHNSRRTRNTPSILKRRLENSTQRPRASNAAAHKKSKLSHESYTPINNGVGHAPPLPLVQESLQSVLISYSGSNSNGSINHTKTYNLVSSNVSYSNQGWQFYGAQGSNSVGHVQQQQPIINQPLQSYRSQPLHGGNATTRMINTQQSNVLGNITHIDLSSPPPSPPPPTPK